MKHTFDGYEWDGDDNVPAQFSVDIPDRIYLQITDEDGSEFSETVIRDDGDRTFCEDRINQTDVEYVHHKLYAAALARAEAAEAQLARLRARLEEYDAEWRPHPDATAGEEGEA